MKKLLFTLLAVCALTSLQASRGDTYQVDDSGCVTVGARKELQAPAMPTTPKGPNGCKMPKFLKF